MKMLFAHREVVNRLQKHTAIAVAAAFLMLLLPLQRTFALSQNTGFENNLTDWSFTGSGTFSVNTNALYFRGGVQSLKLNTTSTTDSKGYDANYTVVAPSSGTNYITVLAWIRADAAIGECAVGIYDATSSTLTKASTTFTPITSGFIQMYYTFAAINGHTYYPYLYGRSTTGAAINIYFDDVIIFTSTYSTSDITEPVGAANGVSVSVSGTSITLNWSNGTDAESGIDGIMILRASGGQTANQAVKDQCNYNTNTTYGPATIGSYTVIYNGTAISTYTDNTGANGSYTYLLLMRDKAYNYTPLASETRVLAIIGANQSATFSANTSHDGMYIAATCTLNISSTFGDTIRNHAVADIYGVINVQGNFVNTAGGTVNFRSGSLYRYNRNGNASIPVVTANWLTGSTCSIEGMTNTAPPGLNQTFANFTWNCGSQTGAASLPSATFNCNGDLTISGTHTGNLTLNNHTLKGNFTHSSGTVYYTTNDTITFSGTSTQTVNIAGPVESFYIDNNVTISANLTLNKIIVLHTGTFNNSSKTLTLASGSSIVRYTGTFFSAPSFGGNHSVYYMSSVTTGVELPTSTRDLSNLYINTSGNVTLNSTCYINGVLTFISGYFVTSSTNLIVVNIDATATGASSASFIIGPMEKDGNNAFTFDVGKAGYYKPFGMSAPPSLNTQFLAEYFRVDPNTSYNVSLKDPSIDYISRCEYWTLTNVHPPHQSTVTLSWDATSCGITDMNLLIVTHWDGTMWKDDGQTALTGSNTAGTVTATNSVNVFSSPFTLGSRPGPLPITLTSFTAECLGVSNRQQANKHNEKGHAKITWSTASETNSDYFSIQKSEDGILFSELARINAAGNSTTNKYYQYEDEGTSSASAATYYRLKEVDADGSSTYSKIESLHCNDDAASDNTVSAYYNRDGKLIIRYSSAFSSDCVLSIYSNSAMLLCSKPVSTQRGTNEFALADFHPAPGVYFINIQQQGANATTKFISFPN